ncbi:MAG: hypothetical protein NZ483_11130, partial [Verrucomicrobiae bacterium]|nr:hypothetical protein [Verrucomicrobiae bacterium]
MSHGVREVLWGLLALLVVAGGVAAIWYGTQWMNRPLPDAWRFALEIVGVGMALQVAAFALAQFWLVGQRLTLFVGLAFWTAALTDLIQALVGQGIYGEPPSGRDVALVGIWVLGRWAVASLVVIGVWQQRHGHSTPRAARDFRQAVLLTTAAALVLAHLPLVMRLPGLLQLDATISRPWDFAAGVPFAAAMGLCWWIYRQQRGVWLGATFLSLV